jgi:P2 family phage contractile tail tube protein
MATALGEVLRGFNLFVDGKGHRGMLPEFNQPKLTRITKDYISGGLDGAPLKIDMGTGPLDIEFSLNEMNGGLIGGFGAQNIAAITYRLKGSIKSEDSSTEHPVVVVMRGTFTEIDMGQWKAGEPGQTKYKATLVYYELNVKNKQILKYDKLNNELINEDGVNLLADRNTNLD